MIATNSFHQKDDAICLSTTWVQDTIKSNVAEEIDRLPCEWISRERGCFRLPYVHIISKATNAGRGSEANTKTAETCECIGNIKLLNSKKMQKSINGKLAFSYFCQKITFSFQAQMEISMSANDHVPKSLGTTRLTARRLVFQHVLRLLRTVNVNARPSRD